MRTQDIEWCGCLHWSGDQTSQRRLVCVCANEKWWLDANISDKDFSLPEIKNFEFASRCVTYRAFTGFIDFLTSTNNMVMFSRPHCDMLFVAYLGKYKSNCVVGVLYFYRKRDPVTKLYYTNGVSTE